MRPLVVVAVLCLLCVAGAVANAPPTASWVALAKDTVTAASQETAAVAVPGQAEVAFAMDVGGRAATTSMATVVPEAPRYPESSKLSRVAPFDDAGGFTSALAPEKIGDVMTPADGTA